VTSPTASITAPANNATVSGLVPINASAADVSGLTKVDFYADGQLVASDTTAPYSVSWNTSGYIHNSVHPLLAKAYDTAGNIGTSATINAKVADITPPATAITSPANNGTVSKNTNVTVTATATDVSGITKVEFYVNNVLKCTDTSSPYSCIWPVPSSRNIVYSLISKAYDVAGNIKTSAVVSVTAR
jgi:hypothetical protein